MAVSEAEEKQLSLEQQLQGKTLQLSAGGGTLLHGHLSISASLSARQEIASGVSSLGIISVAIWSFLKRKSADSGHSR